LIWAPAPKVMLVVSMLPAQITDPTPRFMGEPIHTDG
jgi:hypothetical protein